MGTAVTGWEKEVGTERLLSRSSMMAKRSAVADGCEPRKRLQHLNTGGGASLGLPRGTDVDCGFMVLYTNEFTSLDGVPLAHDAALFGQCSAVSFRLPPSCG